MALQLHQPLSIAQILGSAGVHQLCAGGRAQIKVSLHAVRNRWHSFTELCRKQRAYVQLVLRSALQAPLPLPGSYFAALLAAPSSSGCFCGRGTSLGTRLPFIALNAFRRSIGAALPTHRALSKGAAGKAEAVPHRVLQMDDSPLGAARIPEPRLAALPAAPGGSGPQPRTSEATWVTRGFREHGESLGTAPSVRGRGRRVRVGERWQHTPRGELAESTADVGGPEPRLGTPRAPTLRGRAGTEAPGCGTPQRCGSPSRKAEGRSVPSRCRTDTSTAAGAPWRARGAEPRSSAPGEAAGHRVRAARLRRPSPQPPRPGASRLRAAICRCRLRPLPARPRPRGAFKRGEGRSGAARGPQRRRHGECGPAPPPVPVPVTPRAPDGAPVPPPAPPRGRGALSSGRGAPRPSAAPDSRGIRRASPPALRRAPLPAPEADGAAERPGRGKGPRRCRAPGRGPRPP